MASNPQILSDLRVIQEAKHDIELLTIYRGVPFICKAKIIEIGEQDVRIEANDPAIVCLLNDKNPRILGSDYFEPSTAEVTAVDLSNGTIELKNFSYIGTKLGERMIVRVEPKTPLSIQILCGNHKISGYMADISINGVGVCVADAAYHPMLKPGTNISLIFELPDGALDLSGTVLSAFRREDTYRLSIRFNKIGAQKSIIFRYLIDRRSEIEEELKEEYHSALSKLS